MKTVLVIGGTGFIGSELVKLLHKEYNVIVFSLHPTNEKFIEDTDLNFIQGDVINKKSLEKSSIYNIDVLVSLMGQITKDIDLYKKINIKGNKNIINFVKKNNIPKTILVSTIMVYGEVNDIPHKESDLRNPQSIYSTVKRQVEDIYFQSGINYFILRLGNVYGNQQDKGVVSKMMNACQNDTKFMLSSKEKIRTFVHVKDVARAIKMVIDRDDLHSRVYNIGTERLKLGDLISIIETSTGKKLNIVSDNSGFRDEDNISINTDLTRDELEFTPQETIENAIKEMIQVEKT
jgi:nucleoside-diphosphate-sugar epimerase